MYKDAIHIALNALTVLEDTHPDEARRYRRLLPTLAVDFARAGNSLTENGLLKLVTRAREENVPLSTLFNTVRGQSLSYGAIATRLNPKPRRERTLLRALKEGNLESFKEFEKKFMCTDLQYESYAGAAAVHGHTDMCLYLAGRTSSPSSVLCKALVDAARHKQYHLVYTFLKDNVLGTGDPEDTIRSALDDGTALGGEKYKRFMAFRKIYSDFRKSSPDVQAAYFTGLETMQHFPLRLRPYLEIRKVLKAEIDDIRTLNQAAFKAAMLFQSKHNLLRYFARWGEAGVAAPLTSLLDGIVAPVSKSVDWPSWGNALIKYGPRMNYAIQFAHKLVSPVKDSKGKISLHLTSDRIWNDFFPHGRKLGRVSELCFKHKTTIAVLEKSLRLWKHAAKEDPEIVKSIPGIDIDGNDFGLPGYRLTKMPYTDPRILFLGCYTGSCEKMGHNFEPTIVDAVSRRKSGFYVLMRENKIKAHSWVWRGEGGQLIVDGWESKDQAVTSSTLILLMDRIGAALSAPCYKEYGISDVLLGRSNKKFGVEKCFEQASEFATRYLCEWYYTDGAPNQWLVRRIRKPEKYETYNLFEGFGSFNHC